MSRNVQKITHLLKKASEGNYLQSSPQSGSVLIRNTKNKQWGYLFISPSLLNNRRTDLLPNLSQWALPDIKPHISIFSRDEVIKIPKEYEMPKKLDFTLTGITKTIKPKDWINVDSCIFEIIECPEIIKIRKELGFTPFMYFDHEFHITLGIQKTK
jgi:hypothetical protein